MVKSKSLLGDCLISLWVVTNQYSISPEEEAWLISFSPYLPFLVVPNLKLELWEVWMEKYDFIKWTRTFHQHTLFFDEACKGNPRVTGGGGILLDPKDQIEFTYSWGIGEYMNNIAEALSLREGLSQLLSHNIKDVMVFNYS